MKTLPRIPKRSRSWLPRPALLQRSPEHDGGSASYGSIFAGACIVTQEAAAHIHACAGHMRVLQQRLIVMDRELELDRLCAPGVTATYIRVTDFRIAVDRCHVNERSYSVRGRDPHRTPVNGAVSKFLCVEALS